MCHLQEAAGIWEESLSLGALGLVTPHTGQAGSSRRCTPREASESDGKRFPPMDCSGMLDWARGLLSAGRPWEKPGGIKATAPQALGFFTFALFAFWLGDWGFFVSRVLGFLSLGTSSVLCFCSGSSLRQLSHCFDLALACFLSFLT